MDNKTLFAVLCILFNQLGVPCFMQGDTKTGIVRLIICFIPIVNLIGLYNAVMGIIMGIKILQMSDEEYEEKKGTFNSGWPTLNA